MYYLELAFDILWLEDCLNDLYDSLPDSSCDDKFALVYESNVKNLVAINTGVGCTEKNSVSRIVQQGGGGANGVLWARFVETEESPSTFTKTWSECCHLPWWTIGLCGNN